MLNWNKKSLFSEKTHHWIYFILLSTLALAMPMSRFLMSLSQILLGVNWLLEGHYAEKSKRFVNNKPAVVFSMIFMIHVVGLLWTQDLAYGIFSDLTDKLPMLTLTFLVVSSKSLSQQKAHILLWFFFGAVVFSSFVGFIIYLQGNYTNFRQIAPFVSHLYLGMYTCMTIVSLPWLTNRLTTNNKWRMLSYLISGWLVVFLFILNSLTGLLCLGGIIVFLAIRFVFRPNTLWVRIAVASAFTLVVTLSVVAAVIMYNKVSKLVVPGEAALREKTTEGNTYRHYFNTSARENGYYVFYFVAEDELREAWNSKSSLDFDGKDLNKNDLRYTLYRYLTSLGYRKDKEGLEKLNAEDIAAIERGIPNYYYTQWPGLLVRLHQTIWEVYWYRENRNPTNHTFAQRLELWKGSWEAFKEKPVLGWGTGDLFIAVEYGLKKIDSKMENYRMKPHNQFLLFLVSLGIIGSLVIYGCYFYFVKSTGAYKYLPFNIFLVIMFITMLANHPIDSQEGQTFFSFFTLFFGFIYHFKKHS